MGKFDRFYPVKGIERPEDDKTYAVTGIALMVFGLILLLTCVMPTKDSLGDSMPMHQVKYSTIHIHQRVCDMASCRVVDVKLKARVI